MSLLRQTYYAEHIELILFFGLVGFLFHRIAKQNNFYNLGARSSAPSRLSFAYIAIAFAIYLINSTILVPFIIHSIPSLAHPVGISWIQVSIMALSILMILCLAKFSLQSDFQKILKDRGSSSPLWKDALWGASTWILAFPLVAAVEQAADLVVYAFFALETYEQVAVLYLKQALSSPWQLIAALIMILGAAPIIEELLFRGLLQTWIKKHLGVKAAILIASLCFALFHVSPSHGAGNLSLVPSLFVFSYFLGFIYERQKSLLSSIILHATFNLVSALRIIFTIE